MGIYAERMNSMTIKVVSPDANIRAILRRRSFNVEFRPGSYERYDESSLAQQLTVLAGNAFDGKRQAVQQALSEATDSYVEPTPEYELDRRRREYRRSKAEIVARGRSAGDHVKVSSTAMSQWVFRIKPGTLETLRPKAFATEVSSAFDRMHADYRLQLAHARTTVYGPTLTTVPSSKR